MVNKLTLCAPVNALILLILSHFITLPAIAEVSVIRLISTTSASNSGLLDVLIPAFEKQNPRYKVNIFATGSGNALHRARLGHADITITNSPKAEDKLSNSGFVLKRNIFMRNHFVLAGPKNDPANVKKNSQNIVSSLRQIESTEATFISRGDDSGTHKRELRLWKQAKIDPYGDWYQEIGTGMGDALKYASNNQGYILSDNGTWLALRSSLNLKVVHKGDKELNNHYTVLVINTKKHTTGNIEGALALRNWLLSEKGQELIDDYKVDGEQLFFSIR